MKNDDKVFGFMGKWPQPWWPQSYVSLPYYAPGKFEVIEISKTLLGLPAKANIVKIPIDEELIRERSYINGIPITTVYKGGKCWRFIKKDGKILMVNEDKTLRSPTEEELRELREIFPGEKFEGGEPPEESKTSREIFPEEKFEGDKRREGLIEEILEEFFGEEEGII